MFKVFMTAQNMITDIHFFLIVFKFNFNSTDKYFLNYIKNLICNFFSN